MAPRSGPSGTPQPHPTSRMLGTQIVEGTPFKSTGADVAQVCSFCPCSPSGMRFWGAGCSVWGPPRTLGTQTAPYKGPLNTR